MIVNDVTGVNIIGGKETEASNMRVFLAPTELDGGLERALGGGAPYSKYLGSKGHLVWLKIDLNATKIINVQNYKRTKN